MLYIIKNIYIPFFLIILIGYYPDAYAQPHDRNSIERNTTQELISIKSINGNFYAYVVLLFNENPHFVNMIQKDSIPLRIMGNDGFHIKEYKNYINRLADKQLKYQAQNLLNLYLDPGKYDREALKNFERQLADRNIILKFTKDRYSENERISLDYCIFGKRDLIRINHPLSPLKEKIYNIQPYIYYDEFSTSNSTFYFDMIYINPDEVQNDYIIARKVLNDEKVHSMYFVGSRINEDIRYCLARAFKNKANIKEEIWKMFIIHELTHKMLNNQYNNFDQITGEELSLCSTIYSNPHLGLSVLYSYMNYNSINPHRLAAINFIKFATKTTGSDEWIKYSSSLKMKSETDLRMLAKKHYFNVIQRFK